MSGIPYYKKASGAKRRAEQLKKGKFEKKLLMKMPKISDMLKIFSETLQSATVVPQIQNSESESGAYIPSTSTASSASTSLVLPIPAPTSSPGPIVAIDSCPHKVTIGIALHLNLKLVTLYFSWLIALIPLNGIHWMIS